MPSTPTTKSQVQAYRFVLRRMQSALVRRDSVMLHDPMRSHGRATVVGFLLGLLGMVGFVVYGLISPSPPVPDAPGIVIGKTSGQIYVVSGTNPKTLTPTFNLASARLLLMSQSGGNAQLADPAVVPDESLKDLPRGRRTGIVDGPQLLPSASQRIGDNWAVCDKMVIDSELADEVKLKQATRETTVFAGVPNLGTDLAPNQAILAVADNNKFYLIYRLPSDPNDPAANNTVRAEINPADSAVVTAFKLNGPLPRPISIGLLNAIPQVRPLSVPSIPNKGGTANFAALRAQGLTNGSVFAVATTSGRETYVLLPTGIQRVSEPVGNMLLATPSGGVVEPPLVGLEKINDIRQIPPTAADALPVGTMPAVLPALLDALHFPTACLGWSLVGDRLRTTLTVGTNLPTPADKKLIDIGKAGPNSTRIDHFYMPTGRAAVVQSATSEDTFGKGPISLISDNGLRYGIPNVATAKGLGIYDPLPRPAPEAIIALLPTGASLNVADAQRNFDDIQVVPGTGSYPGQAAPPSSSTSPGGSSGG
jgi:type VII secretion protein EccB